MKRLAAGYCRTFDSSGLRFHRIGLDRESVDGFVFWTRNAGPFLEALDNIRSLGFPFVVQYGIVAESDAAIADVHAIARDYGPRTTVWRYDPITLSEHSPAWHEENFQNLARALEGTIDQAVIAFGGNHNAEPSIDEQKRLLVKRLAVLAVARGIRLSVCSQPVYLVPGTSPARCIDTQRLSDVAGHEIIAETRPRWPGCLCATALDIGAPLEKSQEVDGPVLIPRRRNHEEDGEFLVPPPALPLEEEGLVLPF